MHFVWVTSKYKALCGEGLNPNEAGNNPHRNSAFVARAHGEAMSDAGLTC